MLLPYDLTVTLILAPIGDEQCGEQSGQDHHDENRNVQLLSLAQKVQLLFAQLLLLFFGFVLHAKLVYGRSRSTLNMLSNSWW